MSDLRAKILGARDIKTERISIPDWDVEVEIRGMTGEMRSRVVASATVREKDEDGATITRQDQAILYPLLLIATVFDPDTGTPVFSDADRDAINGKSAGVLEDVALVACRLSGITPDAIKAIRKNSEATQNGASPSA
jgi:hypothetical protein